MRTFTFLASFFIISTSLRAQRILIPDHKVVTENKIKELSIDYVDVDDTLNIDSVKRETYFRFQFDSDGKITQIFRRYIVDQFEYDETGRITAIRQYNGTTNQLHKVSTEKETEYGWRYETRVAGELINTITTDTAHRIIKAWHIMRHDDLFDSTVHKYDAANYIDSVIYYRRGNRTHQHIKQWYVEDGKPVAFRLAMDQFMHGKGRGKTFSHKVDVNSNGFPIIPPDTTLGFRSMDHNFYDHVPYFYGLGPEWDSDGRSPIMIEETPWYPLHKFVGDPTWYKYQYKYLYF